MYDGNRPLITISGDQTPLLLSASSGEMWLVFSSDVSVNLGGFRASYTAEALTAEFLDGAAVASTPSPTLTLAPVAAVEQVPYSLLDDKAVGVVSDGAAEYANSQIRKFAIGPRFGRDVPCLARVGLCWNEFITTSLTVLFDEFALEQGFDVLEVYDGPIEHADRLIAVYSGLRLPPPVYTP